MENLACIVLVLSAGLTAGTRVLSQYECGRDEPLTLPGEGTAWPEGCTGEKYVLCAGRNVTSLPKDLSPNTETIHIQDTSIRVLTEDMFAPYPALKTIKILINQLDAIENGAFNGIHNLSELYLVFVNLTATDIDNRTFLDIANITRLEVRINFLTDVPEFIKVFTNLEILSLSDNKLQIIADGLPVLEKLEQFHATGNKIRSFDDLDLSKMPNLRCLHIGDNLIIDFTADLDVQLIHLEEIYLQENQIVTLSPDFCGNLSSLKVVNLSKNNLNALAIVEPFSNCSTLKSLDLSFNNIKDIKPDSFHGLASLQELNLGGTNLVEVPSLSFSPLKALLKLSISHNDISVVRRDSLHNLHTLTDLTMSFTNKKLTIEEGAFNELSKLKNLDFGNNPGLNISTDELRALTQLEHISLNTCNLTTWVGEIFMNFSALQRLDMSSNPLNCDCGLSWMSEARGYRRPWALAWGRDGDSPSPTCGRPEYLKGAKIEEFLPIDLTCSEPRIEPITSVSVVLCRGEDLLIEVNNIKPKIWLVN